MIHPDLEKIMAGMTSSTEKRALEFLVSATASLLKADKVDEIYINSDIESRREFAEAYLIAVGKDVRRLTELFQRNSMFREDLCHWVFEQLKEEAETPSEQLTSEAA